MGKQPITPPPSPRRLPVIIRRIATKRPVRHTESHLGMSRLWLFKIKKRTWNLRTCYCSETRQTSAPALMEPTLVSVELFLYDQSYLAHRMLDLLKVAWPSFFSFAVYSLGPPKDSKEIKPVNHKGNQPWILTGRTDAEAEAQYSGHLIWKPAHQKRLWCWERVRAGGEGGNRMRWLASITDSKLQEAVRAVESWHAAVHVVLRWETCDESPCGHRRETWLDGCTKITKEAKSGECTLLIPQRGHDLLLLHSDKHRDFFSSSVRRTGGGKGAMRKEPAENGGKGDGEGKAGLHWWFRSLSQATL